LIVQLVRYDLAQAASLVYSRVEQHQETFGNHVVCGGA